MTRHPEHPGWMVATLVVFAAIIVLAFQGAKQVEALPEAEPTRASVVVEAAQAAGVDPALALATSMIENWSGDRKAWSPTGCCVGIMQVHTMHLGVYDSLCGGSDLLSLKDNACYGAQILARYLRDCKGDERCALRRYVGADTSNPSRYITDVLTLRMRLQEAMSVVGQPKEEAP